MVSGGDPLQIAALKGLAAGSLNVLLAAIRSASWPTPTAVLGAGLVGFLGYGTSLVLVVLALRLLGTARTGACFSTAPLETASGESKSLTLGVRAPTVKHYMRSLGTPEPSVLRNRVVNARA